MAAPGQRVASVEIGVAADEATRVAWAERSRLTAEGRRRLAAAGRPDGGEYLVPSSPVTVSSRIVRPCRGLHGADGADAPDAVGVLRRCVAPAAGACASATLDRTPLGGGALTPATVEYHSGALRRRPSTLLA